MKPIKNIYATKLLIFTLANMLILFAACSKDSDKSADSFIPGSTPFTPVHLKTWDPQPVVDTTKAYMPFLIDEAATSTSTFSLTLTTSEKETWIDLNNNGVYENGIDVKVTSDKPITFKAPKGVFTVYGAVSQIDVKNNNLIKADLRANATLTSLNIVGNKLTPAELLQLARNLPQKEINATGRVVWPNDTSDEIRKMGKTRGYTPYKINRNGEIENNDFALPKSLQAGSIDKLETNEDAFMFIQLSAPENLKKFEVYFKKTGTTTWKYGGIFAKTYFSVSEGVAPETAYTVRVKGIDENGNFVFFEPKDFTTQKVLFKTFRIRIGDEVVSSWNYQNINSQNFPAIRRGSITYDPNSNQLTLSSVELEGDIKYDISTADPEKKLTIRLFGDSNVKGCIYFFGSPLRITGTGKLQVKGIDAGHLQRSALTIDGGCHIKSTEFIMSFEEEITINGATVEAPNIRSIGKINLLGGCKIVKPENGVFKQYEFSKNYTFWTVYTSDSRRAQEIKIE